MSLTALVLLLVGLGLTTYAIINGSLIKRSLDDSDLYPEYLYSITGIGKDALRAPLSAASAGDILFVADSLTMQVGVFDLNGSAITSFRPIPEVQAANPLMVAVDKKDRFYITVNVGSVNKIMVYDRNGNGLYAFPDGVVKGSGASTSLNKPVGVAVKDGKLYVTDIRDQDVKIFDLNGKLLRKFGGRGTRPGQFLYPNGIAVNSTGKIYVSDSNNVRVQVFDEDGKYLLSLGSINKRQLFSLPKGIAIDRMDRVHVVDAFKHKVFVFNRDDKFLFSYGDRGNSIDDFFYPSGISIDSDGRIFIADRQNKRVAVWQVK